MSSIVQYHLQTDLEDEMYNIFFVLVADISMLVKFQKNESLAEKSIFQSFHGTLSEDGFKANLKKTSENSWHFLRCLRRHSCEKQKWIFHFSNLERATNFQGFSWIRF